MDVDGLEKMVLDLVEVGDLLHDLGIDTPLVVERLELADDADVHALPEMFVVRGGGGIGRG